MRSDSGKARLSAAASWMAVKTPKAAMRVGIFMGKLVGFLVAGKVRLGQDKDDGARLGRTRMPASCGAGWQSAVLRIGNPQIMRRG